MTTEQIVPCNGIKILDKSHNTQWTFCRKRETCKHWLATKGTDKHKNAQYLCSDGFDQYIKF